MTAPEIHSMESASARPYMVQVKQPLHLLLSGRRFAGCVPYAVICAVDKTTPGCSLFNAHAGSGSAKANRVQFSSLVSLAAPPCAHLRVSVGTEDSIADFASAATRAFMEKLRAGRPVASGGVRKGCAGGCLSLRGPWMCAPT